MHITQLRAGDQVLGFMRLGLALTLTTKGDGTPYWQVPRSPRRARSQDITKFIGVVLQNNIDQQVLTVQCSAANSMQAPTGASYIADISYTALFRLRYISQISIEPTQPVIATVGGKGWSRPGSNKRRSPYRTYTEVKL